MSITSDDSTRNQQQLWPTAKGLIVGMHNSALNSIISCLQLDSSVAEFVPSRPDAVMVSAVHSALVALVRMQLQGIKSWGAPYDSNSATGSDHGCHILCLPAFD